MERVLRGAPATISVTFQDQHGAPTNPAGAVTVGITRADGAILVAPGAATVTPTDTTQRTFALTPAQTSTLDTLTATWTDAGNGAVIQTQVFVIGGYYASLAELRASHDTLRSPADVSDERIYATRELAELEAERCTGVSFVAKYARVRLAGDGTTELWLPNPAIQTIRSVRNYTTPTTYTAFTSEQLAAIMLGEDGRVVRVDGSVWPSGVENLVVEYEHGTPFVPPDIHDAVMRRVRHFVARKESPIPSRAKTWTAPADAGGGTYQLDQPSRYKTGDNEVDAVYAGWSEVYATSASGEGQNKPVSRTLDYDPQYDSVFHGGRR